MKKLILWRSIFRGILLISLLFRLFFVDKLSFNWDVVSYVLLGLGFVGVILLEVIIYFKKKKGENHD